MKALFNFTAESQQELSFQRGNNLRVTGELDDNWLRGEMGERAGIFPRSYVELIPTTTEEKMRARAKFNFKAKSTSELTMLKGEILEIEKKVDSNWVEVREFLQEYKTDSISNLSVDFQPTSDKFQTFVWRAPLFKF